MLSCVLSSFLLFIPGNDPVVYCKTRVEESTRLGCTQLVGELEHLKTETRLIDEIFASEMGECVFLI